MFCIYLRESHTEGFIDFQATTVDYTVNIRDKFALCKLVQTYDIILDTPQAIYKFPVDYNSAFCDLTITTPREVLKGIVKEKSKAREIYQKARTEGKQAFLAEETNADRDIYKLSMANLLTNDKIVVEYSYITELAWNNGQNVFYIPSFVSPRYGGDFVPNPNHQVKLNLIINNTVSNLKSSILDILKQTVLENSTNLTCQSELVLDTDIEISYDAAFDNKLYSFSASGYHMAISSVRTNLKKNSAIKDLVFVLDCSGSMEGDRIDISKKAIIHCLRKMATESDCKFNIVKYGTDYKIYTTEKTVIDCNETNINNAIEYCQEIDADMGGTETLKALGGCLMLSKNAILITDGDTSDNKRLHELCKQFDCLCVVGIGSGMNRANIADMARYGSGICLFTQSDSDIMKHTDTIINSILSQSIRRPKAALAVNTLTSGNTLTSDQPYLQYILSDTVIDRYFLDDPKLVQPIDIMANQDIPFEPIFMGALVAKRIIQENEVGEFFTKDKMIALATTFNIVTEFTSFVAVGDQVVVPQESIFDTNKNLCLQSQYISQELSNLNCDDKSEQLIELSRGSSDTIGNGTIGNFFRNKIKKMSSGLDIIKSSIKDFVTKRKSKKSSISDSDKEDMVKEPDTIFNLFYGHFDKTMGVFKESIREVVTYIPPEMDNDIKSRTFYILSWLKKTYPNRPDLFERFYKLVLEKNIFIPPAFSF